MPFQSNNFKEYFLSNWHRFLDDCEILLDTNKIKPEILLNILNSIHPSIQFTMEVSENSLPFLDVLINKEGNKIWMNLFSKPTDSKRYVPYNLNHPKHCIKNIPFCLARRICAIVEKSNVRSAKLLELKKILVTQKCPEKIIQKGIEKALNIPLQELRSTKPKNNDHVLPFISTYNPNNRNLFPTIKRTFDSLKTMATTKEIFKNYRLIDSKRQAPSLEKLLCNSHFSSQENKHKASNCGKHCFCCDYIREGESYKFLNFEKEFLLKYTFTCESTNLIYVVICDGCKEEYIGQTGGQLKDRLRIYRQHIRQPEYQQIKVEGHLRNCGKGYFKIFPFFKVKEKNKLLRESYENHFIQRFKPSLNSRV